MLELRSALILNVKDLTLKWLAQSGCPLARRARMTSLLCCRRCYDKHLLPHVVMLSGTKMRRSIKDLQQPQPQPHVCRMWVTSIVGEWQLNSSLMSVGPMTRRRWILCCDEELQTWNR